MKLKFQWLGSKRKERNWNSKETTQTLVEKGMGNIKVFEKPGE